MSYDLLFKVVVVGNTQSGKTSIVGRFCNNNFVNKPNITIGVDYNDANIIVDNKIIKLQIWDTAGQEKFRTITRSYYAGVKMVFIVFDIADKMSFYSLKDWINEVKKHVGDETLLFIVGNKKDLIDTSSTYFNDIKSQIDVLLQDCNISGYYEVSAKTGGGISEMFRECSGMTIKKLNKNYHSIDINKNIKPNTTFNKGCCTIM